MKTTTFNVCAWILLASLAVSVSARAKTTEQRTEVDDVNKINDEAEQQRMSKAGSVARNWEVARGSRDGTPNSYAKQLDSRIGAHEIIKDVNTDNADESALFGADKTQISNEEVFGEQRNVYEQRAAVSRNVRFSMFRRKKKILTERIEVPINKRVDGEELTPADIEKAKQMFTYNNKKEVIVHSDGSACKHNRTYNKPLAGSGIWFGHDNPLNLGMQVPGPQTNNNAELYAAIMSMERIKIAGLDKAYVYIDSHYLNKVLTFMHTWKEKEWRTSSNKKVKNLEMIERLDELVHKMGSVHFNYTTYATGIPGNREAEKIARFMAKCKEFRTT